MPMEAQRFEPNSEIYDVVTNLNGAITSMRLYPDQHPQVQHYVDNAHFELTKFLLDKKETTLLLVNDRIVCDQEPLPYAGPHFAQFVRTLREAGIQRLSFISGVTKEELQEFLRNLIATDEASVRTRDHVRLGKLDIRVDFGDMEALQGALSVAIRFASPAKNPRRLVRSSSCFGGPPAGRPDFHKRVAPFAPWAR